VYVVSACDMLVRLLPLGLRDTTTRRVFSWIITRVFKSYRQCTEPSNPLRGYN
jgi:hypothetical protein